MAWWHDLKERLAGAPRDLAYQTYEQQLRNELVRERLPKHVAVQADGNRRWARTNAPDQPLIAGYRAGADKLVEFCQWCADVDIDVVTLWVLSTDNLNRAGSEVDEILTAIEELVTALARVPEWHVGTVGDLSLLPEPIAERLRTAASESEATAGSLRVNVAVAYGGKHELRDAVRSLLAAEADKGTTLAELARTVEVEDIADHLYTKGQPDPDLVIRTSGEQRLGGFLLWQSTHSEFYFCEAYWPDFRRVDFLRAVRAYAERERRFGA